MAQFAAISAMKLISAPIVNRNGIGASLSTGQTKKLSQNR
jgi:hypothetical protein